MIYKNNPFNLRSSRFQKRPGQTRSKNGFCQFVSEYYGIRAAVKIIWFFRSLGIVTLSQIVYEFSSIPTFQKDYYLKEIVRITQIPPKASLNDRLQYAKVLLAISVLNKYPLSLDQILEVMDSLEFEKALRA